MKKPITLEDALSISIKNMESRYAEYEAMMENSSDYSLADEMQELKQAANILRNMAEEPVEKSADSECVKCNECSAVYELKHTCPSCGCSSWNSNPVPKYRRTWIETRTIKIVDVETDVKFDEVD